MKKRFKQCIIALLLSALIFSYTKESSLLHAEDFSQYRDFFKQYEYLMHQHGLTEARFHKMMYYITASKNYYDMEAEGRERQYTEEIMKALEEFCGDLKNSDLSDLEKALILHDRLILAARYDEGILCPGSDIKELRFCDENAKKFSYSAYGVLVDKVGVCQSYATAYMLLMNYVGVDCDYSDAEDIKHAWNTLTIDGVRYLVDTTHDDPIPDRAGRVSHKNFLISSKGYYDSNESHRSASLDMSINDTRYESAFWRDTDAPFLYVGGKIYYLDEKKRTINLYKNGKSTILKQLKGDTWKAGANSFWEGSFYSLASDGNKFYYNDSTHIYEFDPVAKNSKKVWSPSLQAGKYESIYGFHAADGKFQVSIFHDGGQKGLQYRTESVRNPDLEVFFKDFPKASNPARDALAFCVEHKILGEVEARKLRPELSITRAQLVTMLWRMSGSPEASQGTKFRDLQADWYKGAVAWALEQKIVSGMSEVSFEPDKKISKQDLLVILHRFDRHLQEQRLSFKADPKSKNKNLYTLQKGAASSSKAGWNAARQDGKHSDALHALSHYRDAAEIGSWSVEAILWAERAGLLSAKGGSFMPNSEVSREQMALYLKQFILMKR